MSPCIYNEPSISSYRVLSHHFRIAQWGIHINLLIYFTIRHIPPDFTTDSLLINTTPFIYPQLKYTLTNCTTKSRMYILLYS